MTTRRDDAVAVTDEPLELGESPLWWCGRLYLVDILSGTLLALGDGPESELQRLEVVAQVPVPLGAAIPVETDSPPASGPAGRPPERWLVAAGTGIAILEPPGHLEWLDRPEDGNPISTRMNDAATDPTGRFWAGSMGWNAETGAGSVYRIGNDGRAACVLKGITIPNGPAFSPTGDVMYLADSAAGRIDRMAVDARRGTLGARQRFATVEANANPDGMAVDAAGALWAAVWGTGTVRRYLPDGTLDTVIEVSARQPSSVCFGGPDMCHLYITTARYGLDVPSPGDGLIYAVKVEVAGVPVWPARLPSGAQVATGGPDHQR